MTLAFSPQPSSPPFASTPKQSSTSPPSSSTPQPQPQPHALPTTTKAKISPQSSIESTYTSLIQQYLSLLQYDNAIFIAERFMSYNSTPYSNYLLAMCYYRSHKVQYAKRVLTNWCQKNNNVLVSSMTSTNPNPMNSNSANSNLNIHNMNGNRKDETMDEILIGENIIYLLAKCNIDLELWKDAEDALLKIARMKYINYKKKAKEEKSKEKKMNESNGNGNTAKKKIDVPVASSLEEYLVELVTNISTHTDGTGNGTATATANTTATDSHRTQTLNKHADCPIPNGAAGFHLLGIICQRTMRTAKASIFYQLALKLDPMMWTSYEALCEMGEATTSSKPELDPTSIFGVMPSNLTKIPQSKGGYGPEINNDGRNHYNMSTNNNNNNDISRTSHGHGHGSSSNNYHHRGKTVENQEFLKRLRDMGGDTQSPFHITNASPIMTGGGGASNNASISGYNNQSTFAPQTPYTHNDHIDNSGIHATSFFPQTGTSTNSGATNGGHLPSTTLFGTPGLTPIPHQQQPQQYMTYSSAKKDEVFSRARKVASRSYYEPSPEMTPPSYYNYSRKKKLTSHHTTNTPTQLRSATSSVTSSLKMSRRKQYKPRHDHLIAVDEIKQGEFVEQRLLFDGMNVGGNGNSDEDMAGGEEEDEVELLEEIEKMNDRVGGRRKHVDSTTFEEDFKNQDAKGVGEEGIVHILELFCTLGAAQRMLCSYHCKEAIHIFRSLPNNQYNTGFVQHQVGRAYFEMADYPSAQRALETMQRLEPHRMKGLELLSTVFWHLKKEVDLSSLAQRVVEFDKMAPESWCVVGNCFSLQKEHETALAFFRRSIQLDASFTYSHTLSGHEYVSNEDFEQAVACFRNAIRNDDRHYTAWYGLGAIYFRQEKYDLAEYHFKKALSINPQSSVLHCHLGMAQHANGRNQEALDTLACAFRVDPRNPQARYQRATIWMSIDKPKEALKELEKVRDAAPREASVHFAMGKVLKRLNKPEEAMRCFLTALDLDPKDNNQIKAAIDRLDDPKVLEEDVSTF